MTTQTLSVGPNPKIEITHIGGDLTISGWGRTDLEANGDDFQEIKQDANSLRISSGGDMNLSVPSGANLQLKYVGGDLSVENLDGALETSYVGGDAKFQNLNGEVFVSGVMGDLQMENVANAHVGPGKVGPASDLSEQIRRKVEAATQRAQKQVERATRRAEQKMRQAERHSHRWNVNWTAGSNPAVPPSEPVSDEERMSILKMLQDKKITSEQAEKLLSALEGGE